jgi:hypothetical protein
MTTSATSNTGAPAPEASSDAVVGPPKRLAILMFEHTPGSHGFASVGKYLEGYNAFSTWPLAPRRPAARPRRPGRHAQGGALVAHLQPGDLGRTARGAHPRVGPLPERQRAVSQQRRAAGPGQAGVTPGSPPAGLALAHPSSGHIIETARAPGPGTGRHVEEAAMPYQPMVLPTETRHRGRP